MDQLWRSRYRTEAGSDAGNVQTTATRPRTAAYILNGTKHYITNGGIAF